MIIRKLETKDYTAYKRLFKEAYGEYLDFLKRENPQQYQKERREKREASRACFDFYVKTGSSFVAEEEGEVIGYVTSQTVRFMHGADKLLWIEYIVVQRNFRKRGVGLALLHKLIAYAERSGIDKIYTTINPDNEASINLHRKSSFHIEDRKIATWKKPIRT